MKPFKCWNPLNEKQFTPAVSKQDMALQKFPCIFPMVVLVLTH